MISINTFIYLKIYFIILIVVFCILCFAYIIQCKVINIFQGLSQPRVITRGLWIFCFLGGFFGWYVWGSFGWFGFCLCGFRYFGGFFCLFVFTIRAIIKT